MHNIKRKLLILPLATLSIFSLFLCSCKNEVKPGFVDVKQISIVNMEDNLTLKVLFDNQKNEEIESVKVFKDNKLDSLDEERVCKPAFKNGDFTEGIITFDNYNYLDDEVFSIKSINVNKNDKNYEFTDLANVKVKPAKHVTEVKTFNIQNLFLNENSKGKLFFGNKNIRVNFNLDIDNNILFEKAIYKIHILKNDGVIASTEEIETNILSTMISNQKEITIDLPQAPKELKDKATVRLEIVSLISKGEVYQVSGNNNKLDFETMVDTISLMKDSLEIKFKETSKKRDINGFEYYSTENKITHLKFKIKKNNLSGYMLKELRLNDIWVTEFTSTIDPIKEEIEITFKQNFIDNLKVGSKLIIDAIRLQKINFVTVNTFECNPFDLLEDSKIKRYDHNLKSANDLNISDFKITDNVIEGQNFIFESDILIKSDELTKTIFNGNYSFKNCNFEGNGKNFVIEKQSNVLINKLENSKFKNLIITTNYSTNKTGIRSIFAEEIGEKSEIKNIALRGTASDLNNNVLSEINDNNNTYLAIFGKNNGKITNIEQSLKIFNEKTNIARNYTVMSLIYENLGRASEGIINVNYATEYENKTNCIIFVGNVLGNSIKDTFILKQKYLNTTTRPLKYDFLAREIVIKSSNDVLIDKYFYDTLTKFDLNDENDRNFALRTSVHVKKINEKYKEIINDKANASNLYKLLSLETYDSNYVNPPATGESATSLISFATQKYKQNRNNVISLSDSDFMFFGKTNSKEEDEFWLINVSKTSYTRCEIIFTQKTAKN